MVKRPGRTLTQDLATTPKITNHFLFLGVNTEYVDSLVKALAYNPLSLTILCVSVL